MCQIFLSLPRLLYTWICFPMKSFFISLQNWLTKALEDHDSPLGMITQRILLVMIVASTGLYVLESTRIGKEFPIFFHWADAVVLSFFTLEYLARLIASHHRVRFLFSILGLIDLVVLVAYFATFANLGFLRVLRVLRIFQVLKIIRHSQVLSAFFRTFHNYTNEIKILFSIMGLVLLLSSCAMYALESGSNPEFKSVFDAFWWAVVTVFTVGYGDIIPTSVAGKLLSSVIVFFGVATTAIMTAIITRIFIDHFFGKKRIDCHVCRYPHHDWDAKFCKNCGADLAYAAKNQE